MLLSHRHARCTGPEVGIAIVVHLDGPAIRNRELGQFARIDFCQKNPRVRKIRVRNSGAGNGCANFTGAWNHAFFLQEKAMSIKFLVLGGGGVFWVLGGGGSADFIFMCARIFLVLGNPETICVNQAIRANRFESRADRAI